MNYMYLCRCVNTWQMLLIQTCLISDLLSLSLSIYIPTIFNVTELKYDGVVGIQDPRIILHTSLSISHLTFTYITCYSKHHKKIVY